MTIVANTMPGFILDEDAALKIKLQGFSIPSYPRPGTQVPIQVYFRFPDPEERTRTFPHIAIDLVEIVFDETRAHRAYEYPIHYSDPEQSTPLSGFTWIGDDYPLPWSLHYQLATYARTPLQDRAMTAMLYRMFPEQYGSLDMTNFDGTIRRADLVGTPVRRDTVDADKKRLYRNIFTVAISSEFFANQIRLIQNVTSVAITYEPLPAS